MDSGAATDRDDGATLLLLVDQARPVAAQALGAGLDRAQVPGTRVWVWCGPRPVAHVPLEGHHIDAAALTIGGVAYPDYWLGVGEEAARWAVAPVAMARVIARTGGPVVLLSDRWEVLGSPTGLRAGVGDGLALVARHGSPSLPVHASGWEPELAVAGTGSSALLAWWEQEAERRFTDPVDDVEDPWGDFVMSGAGLVPVPAVGLVVSPNTPALPDEAPALLDVSGFDPSRPWRYAPPGRHPLPVADHPWLRRALVARAGILADLDEEGGDTSPRVVVQGDVVPGLRASAGLQRRYRAARLAGQVGSPFAAGQERSFIEWLRAPDPAGDTGISRMADIVYEERADVSEAFPHPRWRDRQAVTRWLAVDGVAQGELPIGLTPALAPARLISGPPDVERFGVNLIGYHEAELGLGVAVRRMGQALDAAGIPWAPVAYDRTGSRSRRDGVHFEAPYYFNLITITAEQLPLFVADVGEGILDGRYTIGQWFWECDAMPGADLASLGLVDEVWGATHYLTDVFSAFTDKPVRHVPVPLEFEIAQDRAEARARFGLDDRFTVLFSFDFFSILQRKNPLGVIEAYRRAFPEGSPTRLVLKSINGRGHPEGYEEVRCAVAGRADIELWDRYLDPGDRMALVAAADCYLSLHRSEGLGLTMAEAMASGTPVVASAFSGNLDFMDDASALLVPGRQILIGEGSYYPAEGHWFDPDLDAAASALQRLRSDPSLSARLADRARHRIRAASTATSAVAVQARLRHLWQARRARAC